MRGLAPPDREAWEARSAWFWRAHDVNAGPAPLDLGPRAGALLEELETVFCTGAWAASVILSWTIVEADARAAARAGVDVKDAPDVDWLRERRNRLVHVGRVGDKDDVPDEGELRAWAEGAVRIVFKTLFAGAWR
jgi:hypothetical protein